MAKKVIVINGSPTIGGNTECLSNDFAEGAREAGNTVHIIRLSDLKIAPYTGVEQTVNDDDMKQVVNAIVNADVVVLASPVYWMFFSAQIKTIMDRLGVGMKDALGGKEVALLLCAASPEEQFRKSIVDYYKMCFIDSLGWKDRGVIAAGGVFNPGDVQKTPYAKQAYELGKSL